MAIGMHLKFVRLLAGFGTGAILVGACSVETGQPGDEEGTGQSQEAICMEPPCGAEPPYCGDGLCNQASENPNSCPGDCNETCGNGICRTSKHEYYSNCPRDCTTSNQSTGVVCGDGVCDKPGGEGPCNCNADCSGSCKPIDSTKSYTTWGVSGCSYRCQDCGGWVLRSTGWTTFDGACVKNSFGALYCEFDSTSCYDLWACCVF